MGQVLATLTDLSVTPAHYITPSVALFMFVATIIGGNTPLLIPLVMDTVGYSAQVYIDFAAASVYIGEQSGELLCEYYCRIYSYVNEIYSCMYKICIYIYIAYLFCIYNVEFIVMLC